MPDGESLRRRVLPAVPHRWTLLRAMRVLGVEPLHPRTTALMVQDRPLYHGELSRRHIKPEDDYPGGVEYLYETAREAFRQASLRHHPDHGGSEEAMQSVNAAWQYLRRRWGPATTRVVLRTSPHRAMNLCPSSRCTPSYSKWVPAAQRRYHHCRLAVGHGQPHMCTLTHAKESTVCVYEWPLSPQKGVRRAG